MRLLLVEDEPSAARLIAQGLREHAFSFDVARDGGTATEYLSSVAYDIVVLDVMLPNKDGLTVCRDLRAAGSAVPVLMLTARDSVDARIQGLESGADDYLVKPFDFRELLARLRALIRRRTPSLAPERFEFGALVLDTRTREVFISGRAITLTAREYALLEYLCRRAGELITRRDIANHVWDDRWDPLSNVIDVYIQRLRRKLDFDGVAAMIRTRRGEGYQFLVPLPKGEST
jgi:two-component system, OmpR family, copper resistance phosphate regulon response regulator CusR